MKQTNQSTSAGCLIIVGLLVFCGGLALGYWQVFPIAKKIVDKSGWQATQCLVLESRVVSEQSSDGVQYSARFVLEWEASGTRYTGGQLGLMEYSSSSSSAHEKAVERFPEGSENVCFYRIEQPDFAVLDRSVPWFFWLLTALAVLLSLVGAYLVLGSLGLVSMSTGTQRQAAQIPSRKNATLKPLKTPVGSAVLFFVFSLCFGGATLFMIRQLADDDSTFLRIFVGVFSLVSIACFIGFFKNCLRLFNPVPKVIISSARPRPGEKVRMRVSWSGKWERLDTIKIFLRAFEEVTYQQGTDRRTDTHEFFKETIFTSRKAERTFGQGASQTVELTIPRDQMHSFESNNNAIKWQLEIEGEIARWPDVDYQFALFIAPKAYADVIFSDDSM